MLLLIISIIFFLFFLLLGYLAYLLRLNTCKRQHIQVQQQYQAQRFNHIAQQVEKLKESEKKVLLLEERLDALKQKKNSQEKEIEKQTDENVIMSYDPFDSEYKDFDTFVYETSREMDNINAFIERKKRDGQEPQKPFIIKSLDGMYHVVEEEQEEQ